MATTGTAPATLGNTSADPNAQAKAVALARVHLSAKWFYWIAALSVINSVVVISGGNFHFVIGLGITSVVDALARQAGSAGIVLDVVINGIVAGVFASFGYFGCKAQKWAFIVGMVVYLLDGLLLLSAGDVLSVAFHGYVLYRVYGGLSQIEPAIA